MTNWGPGLNDRGWIGEDTWRDDTGVFVKLSFKSRYSVSDSNNHYEISGSHNGSGSVNISHGANGGITELGTFFMPGVPQYGRIQEGSWSATFTGLEAIPGTMTVAGTWLIPAKPYERPRQPLNPRVRRVNDNHQVVEWDANYDGAQGPQPWHGVVIERSDTYDTTWRRLGTVGWDKTSYSDTSTIKDRDYQYRMYAYNPAGGSGYVYTPRIRTKPWQPSHVWAEKSGTDVVVSWRDNAVADFTFDVYREWTTATGVVQGAWEKTGIPGNSRPVGERFQVTFTGLNPAHSHRFKVRAWNSSAGFSPDSSWSNAIGLTAPPNAPTITTLAQVSVAGQAIPIAWSHRPVDGSAQTARQVRYRRQGTTTWTTNTLTTSASTWSIPASQAVSGRIIEVEVRTKGAHADYGDWSPTGVTRVSARPTVTLADPSWTNPALELSWTFADTDGDTQAAYRVTVTDSLDAVVYESSGLGEATTHTTSAVLKNDRSYTVTVEVQDSSGLWSTPASRSGTITFPAPPTPAAEAVWDSDTGSVLISYVTPVPVGNEAPAVSATVYRQEGGRWVVIGEGLPITGSMTDRIPPLSAEVVYRVVTVTAAGAIAEGEATADTSQTQGWVYFNSGPGWDERVQVRYGLTTQIQTGRTRKRHRFARPNGMVTYTSPHRHWSAVCKFDTIHGLEGSTLAEVAEFVREAVGPVCYRDPSGGQSGGLKKFVTFDDLTGGWTVEDLTSTGSLPMIEESHRE